MSLRFFFKLSFFFAFLVFFSILFVQCKKVSEEAKEEKLRKSFRERLGLSEGHEVNEKDKKVTFDNFSLLHYKEHKKHYNIFSKQSLVYTETKITKLDKVRLTFFNDKGGNDLVLAKKGTITEEENIYLFNKVKVLSSSKKIDVFTEYLFYDSKTEKITFLTNVIFNNKSGENATIKGQFFIWDKKKEIISSHEKVEVLKSNGDTIFSEGFYSDQEFENAIFSNATGSTEIETE